MLTTSLAALTAPISGTRQKSVLVIDDSLLICDMVYWALTLEGYTVQVANDSSAIYLAERTHLDLILLDLLLPEMDGGAISRALKASVTTQAIPIVMMTVGTVQEAHRMGVRAEGFLPKPFTVDDLLATVRWHIGQGVAAQK